MHHPDGYYPPPPPETNGWGKHVASSLGEVFARLRFHEQRLDHHEKKIDDLRLNHRASDAPTTSPPAKESSKEVWAERKETAKEVSTALRWGLGIILIVLMAFKKIEVDQLRSLGKLFGGGA